MLDEHKEIYICIAQVWMDEYFSSYTKRTSKMSSVMFNSVFFNSFKTDNAVL